MYYPVSALLIECLILCVVEREDSYIKESTLYPILRKLENSGYLVTYNQEYQGRNRKYYAITEEGKEQLKFLKEEWKMYRNMIDDIIEGRVEK